MTKPFEAEQKSLEELMITDGRYAYAIPPYQRKYVWRTEENQKLWDDVIECYRNESNHFLGSFVLMDYEKDEYEPRGQADELLHDSYTVKHVVDGQQRLTSLSLILAALYYDMLEMDSFFSALPDLDDQEKQDWDSLKTRMRDCLVTSVRDRHSKSGKGYIPHLIPVPASYEAYKSIVNKEGFGKQLLVEKAFRFHLQNVESFRTDQHPETRIDIERKNLPACDLYKFYRQMYNSIAQRMKIVRIDCAKGEDAFQVFESLNGTGMRLTSADRIKNFVMGKGSKELSPVPTSKIEAKWKELGQLVGSDNNIESFLSAYLFCKTGKRVPKRDLTIKFMNSYFPKFNGVADMLIDLQKAASCYAVIVNQSSYFDDSGKEVELDPKVQSTLIGIRNNYPAQSVVPLLATALQYGFDSRFNEIADRLLVLLVRHKVCQKSSNMLDAYFEKFCVAISQSNVAEVIDLLKKYQQPDLPFTQSFESLVFDPSKASENARARYYLEKIENYLRNKEGDCCLDVNEELTLEHVIPQAFDPETWFKGYPDKTARFQGEDGERVREEFETGTIWSIGNLCLLRRPENSGASNGNFEAKKNAYQRGGEDGKTAAGTFRLVQQIVEGRMEAGGVYESLIVESSTFDENSVRTRAQVLAGYAAQIWA